MKIVCCVIVSSFIQFILFSVKFNYWVFLGWMEWHVRNTVKGRTKKEEKEEVQVATRTYSMYGSINNKCVKKKYGRLAVFWKSRDIAHRENRVTHMYCAK